MQTSILQMAVTCADFQAESDLVRATFKWLTSRLKKSHTGVEFILYIIHALADGKN